MAKLRQQATLETRPEKELHSPAELTAEWGERATLTLGEDATTWAPWQLVAQAKAVLMSCRWVRLCCAAPAASRSAIACTRLT